MTATEAEALRQTAHRTVAIEESILRDYFAGLALPVFLKESAKENAGFDTVAQMSYDMADAMLEQRKR